MARYLDLYGPRWTETDAGERLSPGDAHFDFYWTDEIDAADTQLDDFAKACKYDPDVLLAIIVISVELPEWWDDLSESTQEAVVKDILAVTTDEYPPGHRVVWEGTAADLDPTDEEAGMELTDFTGPRGCTEEGK